MFCVLVHAWNIWSVQNTVLELCAAHLIEEATVLVLGMFTAHAGTRKRQDGSKSEGETQIMDGETKRFRGTLSKLAF